MHRQLRTAAFVLAAALLGVACSSSTKSVSKADFVSKANAACKSMNATLSAKGANVTTDAQAKVFILDTAVPEEQKTLAALKALGYPAGDKAALDKLYADLQASIDKLKANPLIINDPSFTAESKKLNVAFDALGLEAQCGSGSSTSS